MHFDFCDRRALVTGAGKGIGRAIAIELFRCGAEVVALSRTRRDLESLREECDCQIVVADLADPQQAREAAEGAGPIHLLVNNAGISIPQGFFQTTPEAFDATMAVNVRAVMLVSQIIAAGMIARHHQQHLVPGQQREVAGRRKPAEQSRAGEAGARVEAGNHPVAEAGAIVNISSQASMVGLQDHAAYCASKGALDQLTRVMALELGPHHIRVNAVNPTVTLTPMGAMAWSDPAKRDPMLNRIPLHRFATPEDVAHAVVWLLSEKAGMVSGVTLPVDGGFLSA